MLPMLPMLPRLVRPPSDASTRVMSSRSRIAAGPASQIGALDPIESEERAFEASQFAKRRDIAVLSRVGRDQRGRHGSAANGRSDSQDIGPMSADQRNIDAPGDQASATQLSNPLKPEAWKKLRMLSIDNDKTTQAFGEEAINLLFENSDRIVSALTQPQAHVDVSAPVAPAPKTINHNPTFAGKLVRPRSDARRSTNHVDGGDRETDG
jgi:hypothetical protein